MGKGRQKKKSIGQIIMLSIANFLHWLIFTSVPLNLATGGICIEHIIKKVEMTVPTDIKLTWSQHLIPSVCSRHSRRPVES